MTCEHGCCQGPVCANPDTDPLTPAEIAALLAEERRNRRFERYRQTRRCAFRQHTIKRIHLRWGRQRPRLRTPECMLAF